MIERKKERQGEEEGQMIVQKIGDGNERKLMQLVRSSACAEVDDDGDSRRRRGRWSAEQRRGKSPRGREKKEIQN